MHRYSPNLGVMGRWTAAAGRSIAADVAAIRCARRHTTNAFAKNIKTVRNIGISAHIDSGKTTLTERILFYTGRISQMHEVKGSDEVGATMDSMELEKERGITIRSAATYCRWKDININIIDTPGHVDFTIEVERALRVLDGGILLLCGVAGVQSQTITVLKQMQRYNVPSLCFINKLDRDNADPKRGLRMLQEKLKLNAAFVQLNVGISQDLEGVIDVVDQIMYRFAGRFGEKVVEDEVPNFMRQDLAESRLELLGRLADADDEMANFFLNEEFPSPEEFHAGIRRATMSRKFVPVLVGSAYKNKGVQLLLDAVGKYFPNPSERQNFAFPLRSDRDISASGGTRSNWDGGEVVRVKEKENVDVEKVALVTDDEKPLIAMIYKMEETHGLGLCNYVRVYQGRLRKIDRLVNTRTGSEFQVPKLVRMHANHAEIVDEMKCGEICTIVGDVGASSGDTLQRAGILGGPHVACESMYIPPRVMSLAIKCENEADERLMEARLKHFMREDPTFAYVKNHETGETIIEGMGELHLEIYLERMRREWNVPLNSGKPTVNYREVITKRVDYDYLYKRQSGGQGQFAHVKGFIEPLPVDFSKEIGEKNEVFVRCANNEIREALQKSFSKAIGGILYAKGKIIGAPLWGVKVGLTGGSMHQVDSTDVAFKNCATGLWEAYLPLLEPTLLEPWMNVEITTPSANTSDVMAEFSRRNGMVFEHKFDSAESVIVGETALDTMFGFISALRKLTKGQGTFSMEFKEYRPMALDKAQDVVDRRNSELGRPVFDLRSGFV